MSSHTNTIDTNPFIYDCLIIGAGMSGLAAAHYLQQQNRPDWHVAILEKSPGVGGRMATRRIETPAGLAVFDHGAQYISVREASFREQIEDWCARGITRPWFHALNTPKGTLDESYPRYVGHKGMTHPLKDWAESLSRQGVTIALNTEVLDIQATSNTKTPYWQITTAKGENVQARTLLLTAPIPQTLKLLKGLPTQVPHLKTDLEGISYRSCLSLLLVTATHSSIPAPGHLKLSGEPLAWIADNYQKGISPVPSLTLHAGPEFSARYFSASDEVIRQKLLFLVRPWTQSGASGEILDVQIKRWQYSEPETKYPAPYAAVCTEPLLLLAGDAFGGPRVEGAFLSGHAAGQALNEALTQSFRQ